MDERGTVAENSLEKPGSSTNAQNRIASIIVPHYGSYENLRNCLNSIIAHTSGVEIIVVDNDQLPLDFTLIFPSVKLIRSGSNRGYGSACNMGARLAKSPVLVFMNNDVEVTLNWLRPLLGAIAADDVAGVCPLVVFRDKTDVLNAAGGSCDPLALAWRRGMGESRDSKISGPFFWLPGCCFAIRKNVFNQIGGFDESLFLFLEDVDLSWRMRLAGWDLHFVPDSVVLHKYMASTSKLHPSDIQYLFNRNRPRLILKNYSSKSLARIIPIYTVLQLGLMIWVLMRRRSWELRALLAAWLWNLRNLSSSIIARLQVQALRVRKDSELLQYMYRGIAGVHLAIGTMKHPVFEAYFESTE